MVCTVQVVQILVCVDFVLGEAGGSHGDDGGEQVTQSQWAQDCRHSIIQITCAARALIQPLFNHYVTMQGSIVEVGLER